MIAPDYRSALRVRKYHGKFLVLLLLLDHFLCNGGRICKGSEQFGDIFE